MHVCMTSDLYCVVYIYVSILYYVVPGTQFPISAWTYDADLAFTKSVEYRHGRIVVPNTALYYVYSQVSFLELFGHGASRDDQNSPNSLSHYIYR